MGKRNIIPPFYNPVADLNQRPFDESLFPNSEDIDSVSDDFESSSRDVPSPFDRFRQVMLAAKLMGDNRDWSPMKNNDDWNVEQFR